MAQDNQPFLTQSDPDGMVIPHELPILPLRNTVVFPLTVLPLSAEQARSIRLVDDAVIGDRIIGLVAMKDPTVEQPGPSDVYQIGTAALIHRLLKTPDGSVRLIIQGMERFAIEQWISETPYLRASLHLRPDIVEESVEVEALVRNLTDLFRRLIALVPHLPDELMMAAMNADDPRHLAYLIATSIRMDIPDAQEILEADYIGAKLRKLTTILNKELEVLELGRKIQTEAQSEMEKMQREYFLREQLKAIQKELGEGDEGAQVTQEYREKIDAAGMTAEAKKEALRELGRMEKMPPQAAEYSVIKTYLDWLTDLPWQVSTDDNLDIPHAQKVLDEDHYDLEEIKERIIEYLAVRKLRLERAEEPEEEIEPGNGQEVTEDSAVAPEPVEEQPQEDLPLALQDPIAEGAILCFVGPPGTGKTSLGRSIARAMGRKFTRMSLGGMRDEAEIRGHRRTYIGAMPGRIVQAVKRAGTRNPVFMLDEVDKIGTDWRGDPSSALLEVLDPQQNNAFRDHYLDVDFDLSQVMFITTANLLSPIPAPLRDRMEILELDGYTEGEKVKIAEGYLVPRQMRATTLREDEIQFTPDGLRAIIRDFTREAGVRNLEREIGSVCRKVATKIAAGTVTEPVIVDADIVLEYLGKPKFYLEVPERTSRPGVATGLAVTAVGGDILFVEATKMPGKGGLTLTGQLGEVMRESAKIAQSYVRASASRQNIPDDVFENTDIHLHVPAGAIPKDGPSAGVTMVTALTSLLTRRPVRPNVGMTGEITLRGQVLPVGGIKQKMLAAHRAELTTVILPKRNEKDLDDLPDEVRDDMHFELVERIEQALEIALAKEPIPPEETPAPEVEEVEEPDAEEK
ncbi:MAG: endopeptidase La [Chloroflexi bacterium]|nr:endopeptidase La [Chloroflexota bacterium]